MASKRLFGIIYMSTTKLELMIVDLKTHEVLERTSSANFVQTADKSKIYHHELEKIVFSLNGFVQILKEYGVTAHKFWASQQLIDDVTARYLSEQLFVRTGLAVNWLNTSQINYYRALSLIGHTRTFSTFEGKTAYLLYIGSAAVTLFHFHKQKFVQAWNISLGYLELDDLAQALRTNANDPNEIIDDYIASKLDYLKEELVLKKAKNTVLILQDNSALNNRYLAPEKRIDILPVEEFKSELDGAVDASPQYLMKHYQIEESSVDRVVPSFLITRRLLRYTQASDIYLTRLNIMDGLAIQSGVDIGYNKHDYQNIILTSAENIARVYIREEAHRHMVTEFALYFFDRLKKLHRLGNRERLLLSVAATIADIGNAISQHSHYHHSAYIMEANPLIGLSDKENRIIAEIARYHSAEAPEVEEPRYRHLDPVIQMPIAKLVAILRLADALDDSHQQKISRLSLSLKENEATITAYSTQDLALEKWAFNRKAQLFQEVYGLKPVLKQRRTTK